MKDSVAKGTVAYLGVVLALALIAHCGPAKTPTETQPTAEPGLTPTPSPPGVSVTPTPTTGGSVAGTYTGTDTRQEDTCGIFPSSFPIRVTVTINGQTIQLQIIESATFTSSGTLQPNNSFTTTGSFSFSSFSGIQTVTGQFNGNVLTGTETRDFNSGCPGKRAVFQFNASK